jgi:hypothetical protein
MFGRKKTAKPESDGATASLRDMILRTPPNELGFAAGDDTKLYGALMETGYAAATVTIVSLIDGTTSMYISTGGGTIGAGEHEPVAEATRAFVAMANVLVGQTQPTTDFPLPGVGHVRFQLLTTDGGRTAEALRDDLGHGRHPLSPLFYAGQDVVTQIRLLQESQQR